MKFGPVFCIGFVIMILFVIWVFYGEGEHQFIGLTPLLPGNTVTNNAVFVQPQQEAVCVNQEFVEQPPQEEVIQPPQTQPEVKPVTRKRGFVSKGEKLCCETMEKIYGVPFTSTWPEWLRNPETGEKLELDCYNEDLKLAVEYNGEQHYNWPNFTNQTQEQFINQVRRDEFKMKMCDRNGIYLIVVPYTVKHKDIPSYLISNTPEAIKKIIDEEQILSNFF